MLKALAANIQPIPIPDTVPPAPVHSLRKGQQVVDGGEGVAGRGSGKGKRPRTEVLQVD